MSSLTFLVGLPRSGKSTFAESWRLENPNRVILSGDDFRHAVYNQRFSIVGDELVRACLITAARAMLYQGRDVLIDETNTSTTHQLQILAIDPKAKCYYINMNPEICKQRAIECNQQDLLPSIDRMAKNLSISLPILDGLTDYEELHLYQKWFRNLCNPQ